MDIISKEISLSADGFSDIKNITEQVENFARESDLQEGLLHIFPIGSTASISTIEFEPAWFRI